jgi:TM2 domain-containing membrane protein YozV
MGDAKECSECGEPLVETGGTLPMLDDLDPELVDKSAVSKEIEISPKKRNTVILLCYFLGLFGVHRFYLGKILSGFFMLITFGGITIWYCIDFVFSITGDYTDSKGRKVAKDYNNVMVSVLLIGPIVLLIVFSIAIIIAARSFFDDGLMLN